MDGHWKVLRRNGAHRGVNTKLVDAVHKAVLVRAWAQWAGREAEIRAHRLVLFDVLSLWVVVRTCSCQDTSSPGQ